MLWIIKKIKERKEKTEVERQVSHEFSPELFCLQGCGPFSYSGIFYCKWDFGRWVGHYLFGRTCKRRRGAAALASGLCYLKSLGSSSSSSPSGAVNFMSFLKPYSPSPQGLHAVSSACNILTSHPSIQSSHLMHQASVEMGLSFSHSLGYRVLICVLINTLHTTQCSFCHALL